LNYTRIFLVIQEFAPRELRIAMGACGRRGHAASRRGGEV